jgi:hypothetical protein
LIGGHAVQEEDLGRHLNGTIEKKNLIPSVSVAILAGMQGRWRWTHSGGDAISMAETKVIQTGSNYGTWVMHFPV